jgi:5'/3'-nucleotidase SurE
MHLQTLVAVLPVLGVHGIRIIQSNDDGWAEQYVRSFHNALIASGHDAVLSAPAENKSGTGESSITEGVHGTHFVKR